MYIRIVGVQLRGLPRRRTVLGTVSDHLLLRADRAGPNIICASRHPNFCKETLRNLSSGCLTFGKPRTPLPRGDIFDLSKPTNFLLWKWVKSKKFREFSSDFQTRWKKIERYGKFFFLFLNETIFHKWIYRWFFKSEQARWKIFQKWIYRMVRKIFRKWDKSKIWKTLSIFFDFLKYVDKILKIFLKVK